MGAADAEHLSSWKLVDTSLFIGYERGDALAAKKIAELLESGELVVSAVTRYELTCTRVVRAAARQVPGRCRGSARPNERAHRKRCS